MAEIASLHRSSRKGNLKKVRQFISQVKNKEDLEDIIESRFGDDGYTVLHQAVIGKNSELLDYLLQYAKRLDYQAKDRSTPLHLAYRLNSATAVTTLLKYGATIPFKDTRSSSLLTLLLRTSTNRGSGVETIYSAHKEFLEKCKGSFSEFRLFIRRLYADNSEWHRLLATTDGRQLYTPIHHAAANGRAEQLDWFLSHSLRVSVHYQTKDGSTALHLAARRGHTDCVTVLLNYGAEFHIRDKSNKTVTDVAHRSTLGILRSEDNMTDLLEFYSEQQLEPKCLKRAMIAAVMNDDHFIVGKLIIKGASSINDYLEVAKQENKPHARAMLLLVKASMEGRRDLVLMLFGEPAPYLDMRDFQDDGFQDVQKAVLTGKVSTVVPIEIARRNGHAPVREELLLKTDVYMEEGTVYWHGLRLLVLDVTWLRKIHWVKKLGLAHNGFKTLPNEMGPYLKQVVKLDLQHNELSTIPGCILELPSLSELNLSHNKLEDLPDVPEWSSCLTVLDISYNRLSSLPMNAVAPAIRALNISNNSFRTVPICICSFTTLLSLDLSDNPNIITLPAEMGRLTNLARLNLSGLKRLREPPKKVRRECRDCIRYLNSKLRRPKSFYRMKLMVVGLANRGKTTLVARLQGQDCGDESTIGVDVSEWLYKPSLGRIPFHFNIWDFGGQEEYYATHQCFLSQRSIYLLLFNLKHGENGVQELKSWLNNIALQACRSCVIIVGTHLDEVADDERGEVDVLLQKVGYVAASYSKNLQVVEVIPVGLRNRIENIGILKEAIYDHAANYKTRGGELIMGQKIPASYHALDKKLEVLQQEVRGGTREPIMHVEEFKTMVQQMSLADIQNDDELKTAAAFLTDVGSLLHYDDRSHNLDELYFIDPRWLCDMISKIVTIKERNPFVRNGILHSKDIPFLFKDREFPWQYFEQYLTLLDRFEIALPLDNKRILIPSMLQDERPDLTEAEQSEEEPLYSRYIIFNSADTPPGFWSRLLSRIMHSVTQIGFALDKTSLDRNGGQEASLDLSTNPVTPSTSPTPEDTTPASPVAINVASSVNDEWEIAQSIPVTSHVLSPAIASPTTGLPVISGPVMNRTGPQPLIQAPQLLPNFPNSFLPCGVSDAFNSSLIQLKYWRTGLFYKDPEVQFRIESLAGYKQFPRGKREGEGVLIIASFNNIGKKIICQLVDLVLSLVNEWYPGLQDGAGSTSGLEQRVPCYECLKLKRSRPFEFRVELCLPEIARNRTTMECGWEHKDPAKNHTVPLADIVPDLLLQDIDPKFLLNSEDIIYNEDESLLLGMGGYGKVYRGKCHSKPVAIKKYLTRNEDAFAEFRSEAKLLQKSHHPCLVCLVGVYIHPMMALVMEEAPMGSLEKPMIKKKLAIHRVVIHRMAAEVAAALRFLHRSGIIFRDLKAADVLLWSLNAESLCHCKLTNFGIATHLAPVGARGLIGTKGFIAPEVLYIGKRKQHSVYDHRADIFSFGMFLYQMITRRHPYFHLQPQRIDTAVVSGERPRLQDVSQAETAFHYLTRLMQTCWKDNPRNRPTTEEIIKTACLYSTQAIMCVHPVRSMFSLRLACAITPSDFSCAQVPRNKSEIWVCCDGAEGVELKIYNANTMVKIAKNFIKENQAQCICLCGDHVWVGSRAGIEYGVIDIFNISTRELVHNIRMRENSISCITCSDKMVYLGTLEGYCFSFTRDIKQIQANAKPRYKYVSEHAVDGIVATKQCVWVSHTRYIYFLNLDNLAIEGSFHCLLDAFIGQLCLTADGKTVWSAHLGGVILSAWDAIKKLNKFHIDAGKHLKNITEVQTEQPDQNMVITAMAPALDTVWVGMATGHLLVFHEQELLTWCHPYAEYVRFISCIHSSGPCETEKCMVITGAKGFSSPVPQLGSTMDFEKTDDSSEPVGKAGVLVLWEAFTAKMTRQLKLIEENSPGYLENHHTVRSMILKGEFRDGTHILQQKGAGNGREDSQASEINISVSDSLQPLEYSYDSLRDYTVEFSQPPSYDPAYTSDIGSETSIEESEERPVSIMRLQVCDATTSQEIFDITLPGPDNTTIRVSCPKPVSLEDLLSELHVNSDLPEEQCQVEYHQSDLGERLPIHTQEQLDTYLHLENRPQLFLSNVLSNDLFTPKMSEPLPPPSESKVKQEEGTADWHDNKTRAEFQPSLSLDISFHDPRKPVKKKPIMLSSQKMKKKEGKEATSEPSPPTSEPKVKQEEGTADWQDLGLLTLDISWLHKIHWAKRLWLAHNKLRTLPNEMGTYLKQVVKLDLQHNELSTIPHCILVLPCLEELNLSHNQLVDLPDIPEWSSCLTVLDLSHNQLSGMPPNTVAPAIRSLNISHNDLQEVPYCICRFKTLHSLNLSHNPKIHTLPTEMDGLQNLRSLNIRGLKGLRSKLKTPKGFFRMKLMVVGLTNQGKTTLVARLLERDSGEKSTVGVEVSEWLYRPCIWKKPIFFNIWDFGGQEKYYATHQYFLTRSLYLLVFNLKHGDKGVQELTPWLNNIALCAPGSIVIVIGTHLDEVADEEMEEIDKLVQKVSEVTSRYSKHLEVVETVKVGLKDCTESIDFLRKTIYNHATYYQAHSDQMMVIPNSYDVLTKQLEVMQQEVRTGAREPIMHSEEFKTIVQQMNLADIQNDEELKMATLFLKNIGVLLYYENQSHNHNLHELYFIDPRWLCDMMSKVVTFQEKNTFVQKGILHNKDVLTFFKVMEFTLLNQFEISIPLDSNCMLLPLMLPVEKPSFVDAIQTQDIPLYSRYIAFESAGTPLGFWSKLLCRIMHSIPQIFTALKKTSADLQRHQKDRLLSDVCFHTTPVISGPTRLATQDVDTSNAIPALAGTFDCSPVQLHYWCSGLFYSDSKVQFCIESLASCSMFSQEKKEGIVIMASPTNTGIIIVCQLVDLVMSVINDWYPGLQDGTGSTSGINQRVLCIECLKLRRSKPFEFRVEHCLAEIVSRRTTTECGYDHEDPEMNHIVTLVDIVPDCLLQDINLEFHLNSEDILYNNDDALSGGYGKIYRLGKYNSKLVAIKMYPTSNKHAFSELRSEAKLLQKSHHPCLLCLVGVCFHPTPTLVMEKAPMGSLDKRLIRRVPIHRIVVHRMAAEVAAALQFLHSNGIIFRELRAANVLLWSLDPESLCHCKLTNSSITTHQSHGEAWCMCNTKGFIAPEVVSKKQYHRMADTFSFGMLLYQIIARKYPYFNLQPQHIDAAIKSGQRPRLQDVSQAETAFHYLSRLMQTCWEDNPGDRPSIQNIIKIVCLSTVQSIMCIHPLRSTFSLHKACSVTPIAPRHSSEVWVCCDSVEGIDVNIYSTNTMTKTGTKLIMGNQVRCICHCGDHIWVAFRPPEVEHDMINVYNISTQELVNNIPIRKSSVSCITSSDKTVYLGTKEGYCFSFPCDVKMIQDDEKASYKFNLQLQHAVDGIIVTKECVWASHSSYICFLNLDNLSLKGVLRHQKDIIIGQLSLAADGSTVWSAHLGGVLLSAWEAIKKSNKYDIDVGRHLGNFSVQPEKDMVITAMATALDTVWVGMATGHILVFHDEELLTWYHPYTEHIRFISCIPSSGPCGTEACMVITGAKGFASPVPNLDGNMDNQIEEPVDNSGVLILWEAFTAKMTRQIKLVEENSPDFLENHETVRRMIHKGEFKDGTQLNWNKVPRNAESHSTGGPEYDRLHDNTMVFISPDEPAYLSKSGSAASAEESEESLPIVRPQACNTTIEETFDIRLPGPDNTTVRVSCPKPVSLEDLLSELHVNSDLPKEHCQVEYHKSDSGERLPIHTQEQLDTYLHLENRPQLSLSKIPV